jgi:hypothetical protein
MNVVIQIAARDHTKALGILLRHSPGVALRNRTYVVSEGAVHALTEAGVRFARVSCESLGPGREGLVAGERI